MRNLLIIIADQLTAGALPSYGNTVARTPHLDKLAAKGVRFENAYTNSPLCGPARNVLMTGRLPSATRGYDNASLLASDVPSFGHHLRRAGYRTILAGKMHFVGPDQMHGFEERITTDIYPADFGWTPDWTNFAERPEWYHSMDSVLSSGPCARSNQIDYDEEVMFAARRKLFDLARFGDGRPFCMVVSFTHPHDPFNIEQSYWDRYEEQDIDMPRVAPPAEIDSHSARLRHVCAMDTQPVTKAQIRDARHAYYGAVSFIDDQVGMLRETLSTTGQDRDTTIIFLSDHGEMLGERGLWYKMSYFEGACRIPLIVYAPDVFAPAVVRQSVSQVDILPTLCSLADAAPPEGTDGRSLYPHLRGEPGHDEVFGEYCAEAAIAPIVMIRRSRWKFIHSPADPDQLFDLLDDPDELHNLAGSANPPAEYGIFLAEALQRWNFETLHKDVIASQRQRSLVAEALRKGHRTSWDYAPPSHADTAYIRLHKPLDTLELEARLPSLRT